MSVRIVGIASLVAIIAPVGILSFVQRGSNGSITKQENLSATYVRLGDCLKSLPNPGNKGTTLDSALTIPCSQPHHYQVYSTHILTGANYSASVIDEQSNKLCKADIKNLAASMTSSKIDEYTKVNARFCIHISLSGRMEPRRKEIVLHNWQRYRAILGFRASEELLTEDTEKLATTSFGSANQTS